MKDIPTKGKGRRYFKGMSCSYANAFGEPGTGAHAPRLFGVAIIDVLLTLFAAIGSSYYLSRRRLGVVQIRDDDSVHSDEEEIEPNSTAPIPPNHPLSLTTLRTVPPIISSGFVSSSSSINSSMLIAKGQDIFKHFLAWFILAECLHAAFGTNTAVIKSLGLGRCR